MARFFCREKYSPNYDHIFLLSIYRPIFGIATESPPISGTGRSLLEAVQWITGMETMNETPQEKSGTGEIPTRAIRMSLVGHGC